MWAKWADELPRHPKILAAADKLGRSNNVLLVLGFFGCALSYASENLTDGFLPTLAVDGFPCRNPRLFADAMVAAGLWERCDGGYQIHDYHDYNPKAATVREKRAKDRQRKRDGLDDDSARNRDGESSARGHARGHDPVPVPVPVPDPSTIQSPPVCVTPPPSTPAHARLPATGSGVMAGTLPRDHLRHAWCGRVCVPDFLHSEFTGKLTGDPAQLDAASQQLRAWYQATLDAIPNAQPIGDEPLAFWRQHFRAWQPSAAPKTARNFAAEDDAVWAKSRELGLPEWEIGR